MDKPAQYIYVEMGEKDNKEKEKTKNKKTLQKTQERSETMSVICARAVSR